MIALDTNVVLRLLIEDDSDQFNSVKRLMLKLDEDFEEAVITDNTLSEVVWVLDTTYRASKDEILSALQALEGVLGFTIASPTRFHNALNAYINGKGDFADYLLREQAIEVGCRAVATFDKALLKEEGFFRP